MRKGKEPNHPQSNMHEPSSNQASLSKQQSFPSGLSSQVLKGDGLISRLFFIWISCVLKFGNERPIDTHDLPSLHASQQPQLQFQSLNDSFASIPNTKRPGWTLIKAICKAYNGSLIYIGGLALGTTLLSMAAPILTHLIIEYIMLPVEQRLWREGLTLLTVISGLALTKAVIQSHLYFKFAVFGFNLSNTLSLMIFSKALRHPATSQNKFSLSQIINFSQVDAQRMTSMGPQLTAVLYTPPQIAIGIYLMYRYIGISFVVGICTMVGLVTVTLNLAKRISKINKQVNSAKDSRTKITQQMLDIIRFIKVNTLQKFFYRKVELERNEQLQLNRKRAFLDIIVVFIFFASCPLIIFLTFITFTSLGNNIDASIAFSTIMVFNILQSPLRQFPSALSNIIQMLSSLKRIQQFLLSQEIIKDHMLPCEEKEVAINITNGSFGYKKNELKDNNMKSAQVGTKTIECQNLQTANRYVVEDQDSMDSSQVYFHDSQFTDQNCIPIVRGVNLTIQKGQFAIILGEIGSGKSSLLLGILNEMMCSSKTRIQVSGSIAYVSQRPCVISGTVQDNILFGLPYDKIKFEQAIYLSALGQDLKQLVNGELTEIGQKGINLSGGQKMRVSLARAIYSDSEILLLDDLVSAVDSNVAQFIVKVALRGFLREKTILMVTHSVKFSEFADEIILMKDGRIIQNGAFKVVSETQQFKDLFHRLKQQPQQKKLQEEKRINRDQRKIKQTLQALKQKSFFEEHEHEYAGKAVQNLIIPEDHHRGNIVGSVLPEYIKYNGGAFFVAMTIGMMTCWLMFSFSSSIQLQKWCKNDFHPISYLNKYFALSILASLGALGRSVVVISAGLKQGKQIHSKIIKSLLYASLTEFYERVPVGRIMNRLTKDLREIDESIGNSLTYFLNNSFTLIGTIAICIYGSSFLMAIPILTVFYFCNNLRKYYMKTQREVIRIQAKTSSPIVECFVSAVNGLTTVRAFKVENWLMDQQIKNIEVNKRSRITRQALESWFAFRLTLLSFLISFISIAIALASSSSEPALVGLLLSYVLTLNDDIITLTFSWANLETRFVAIERVYSFMKIQPEVNYQQYCQSFWSPLEEQPVQCIQKGEIEFKEVSIIYRPGLPNAIRSLSFHVEAGEKVGIVGRTGAGKSTIFNALLKIICPKSGSILIDNIDYKTIPVRNLRNSITIIDQEPVIINSTFRENLDREGKFKDAQLMKLLQTCKILDLVLNKGGLNSQVDNQSLSAGEKQLICICRALLKKSRIVLIDEATANVDVRHDEIIKEIIDQKLKECTVLTIAHRLSTVAHADKIIVMGDGQMLEVGSPEELRKRFGSVYAELLKKEKSQVGR